MKSIAFFNSGGADKASVVYHLAWMFAELDYNVLVADFDSRVRLTELFLTYVEIENLLAEDHAGRTVYEVLKPLLYDREPMAVPLILQPAMGLSFLAGDVLLSSAQDAFAAAWREGEAGGAWGLDASSAIWRLLRGSAETANADVILVDVDAGFGPIGRACLLAADHVVLPLGPNPYAFPGIRETGVALRRHWRSDWLHMRATADAGIPLPVGNMHTLGYIALPPPIRLDRPLDAHARWLERLPAAYGRHVSGRLYNAESIDEDSHCLAVLRHFVALETFARDARKPMFALKPADGIVGGHVDAVRGCYRDFHGLAERLADACGLNVA